MDLTVWEYLAIYSSPHWLLYALYQLVSPMDVSAVVKRCLGAAFYT
jgi:hypothetical protein